MSSSSMTSEQRAALIEALDEGNPVRVITVALAIAAKFARDKQPEQARAIRYLVDEYQGRNSLESEFRRQRLQIAAAACARPMRVSDALALADELIMSNGRRPVPELGEHP